MSDPSDFVIENGVLKNYVGTGGDVAVPEGVTSIGDEAFRNCAGLTSVTIPDGVTSIGSRAFSCCRNLTRVTIPEGVTRIGGWAFYDCRSLTSVTIPASVTSIGDGAFYSCSSLTDVTIPDDVVSIGTGAFFETALFKDPSRWENEVLYIGNHLIKAMDFLSGAYSAKEGTRCIGDRAFFNCSSLTGVTIPSSATSIGKWAFSGCSVLACMTIPENVTNIGKAAFENCAKLQWVKSHLPLDHSVASGCSFALLLYGEVPRWLAFAARVGKDNLSDFAGSGSWGQYDLELINNGPAHKYKLPARLVGALGRLLAPVELTEENRALYAALLNQNAKKLVPLAEEMGEPRLIEALLSLNVPDEKTAKAVKKLLAASPVPELAALALAETEAASPAPEKKAPSAPESPLQAEYAAKLKAIKGDALIKKMKLIGTAMPAVKLADGTEAPEELFRFLLASYGGQLYDDKPYRFVPEADEAARRLSYDSLCEAMDAVSGHLDGPNYPAVLPLLCRFGNAKQIRALTNAQKSWEDWEKYGQKGRRAQKALSGALVLSDTREAVVWLEKNSSLEKYAALRGVDETGVYERCLFDFGFDESGKRVFDLGNTTIEASLTSELKLALYDTAQKKTVKTVPKKGADLALYQQAADEVADMRQNLKNAARIKTDHLFRDYLDAAELPAERWKRSHLENPFLRAIAKLLVWEQGGKCFVPTDAGAIDAEGQPYTLTDGPVRLAHPMEMEPEELTRWQKYFTRSGLKQPFLQIWEPTYDEFDVGMTRYKGCRINPVYLKNQEKRGIDAEWGYNTKSLRIAGFDVQWQIAEQHLGDERLYLEIPFILPLSWNRRANGVIAYLDRITVWERVKKDDVSVMDLIDRFTLAQVMEMIKTAQEAQAVNVLALLLEYKNTHFADFDPMDEFTLE